MKPDVLQPVSVAIMILGLFLAAAGGIGAYYFAWKTEHSTAEHTATVVDSVDSHITELLARHTAMEERLASIEKQGAATTRVEPAVKLPIELDLFGHTPLPPPGPLLQPMKEHLPAASPQIAAAETPAPIAQGPSPARLAPQLSPAHPGSKHPAPPARKSAATAKAHETAGYLGLSEKNRGTLIDHLRAHRPGSIAIHVAEGSDSALASAHSWKILFEKAGWHVSTVAAVKTHRKTSGVTVSSGTFPPPAEVTAVFSAMRAAGVKVSTDLDPQLRGQSAVVFIGKS